jgi:hypothetical protein
MKPFLLGLIVALGAAVIVSFAGRLSGAADKNSDAENADQKIDESSVASEDETLEHVPIIVKIEHEIQTSDPPNLVITAYGKVPTGGWKQVQLLRRIYVNPPSDGIWEYDMLALPPSGPATQVETLVRAKNQWKAYDQTIKGVRVYGVRSGIKEVLFSKKAADK